MKSVKIIALISSLLLLGSCSDSDPHEGTYDFEYQMINFRSDLEKYEDYFLIEDEESKLFSTQEELDGFLALYNTLSTDSEYFYDPNPFNKSIDFSSSKVYITAMYAPHTNSSFTVSSIVETSNNVEQRIVHTVNTPSTSNSSYGFLFTIVSKEFSKSIKNKFTSVEDYDAFVCYKPIIYFYPTQEMDFKLEYVNKERLLTTYPEYKNGWNLHLYEDSTFKVIGEDRIYNELFFEETNFYNADFSVGFYLNKDNAISFLEEKLEILGYLENEANDFITYWLPTIQNNIHSLIYFEQTIERNNECPLNYSVEPDSILRTIIHIKKVDAFVQIEEQELVPFNRCGFSLVEWGGIIY